MENDIYPLTIVKDRYSGAYSHGIFTAWNAECNEVPEAISSGDIECLMFWDGFNSNEIEFFNDLGEKIIVGKGSTPNIALNNLKTNIKNYAKINN